MASKKGLDGGQKGLEKGLDGGQNGLSKRLGGRGAKAALKKAWMEGQKEL